MIKGIVFDLDGMVYLSDALFSTRVAKEYDIPADDVMEFFRNDFADCQLGKKDLKDRLATYIEGWGWQGTLKELIDFWFEHGHINNDMLAEVEALRSQGYICVLATNNEKHRMAYLEHTYNLSEKFDHVVASYEIGARKPDKAVYDEILRRTGLEAKDILIFDDRESHVAALKAMDFHVVLYDGSKRIKEYLDC